MIFRIFFLQYKAINFFYCILKSQKKEKKKKRTLDL